MCTSIKLRKGEDIILAQNYDFDYGHGLIMTNKRNIAKVAFTDDTDIENLYSDENKGARWISRYGSITFNQFAREFPNFGMNEAGLSITAMLHFTEQKPPVGKADQITEAQWIQMQLDRFSSVEEVVENLDTYSYEIDTYPLHYIIADKSGESVVIEMADGKLTAFRDQDIYACGNLNVLDSLKYSQKYAEKYPDIVPEKIRIKDQILDRFSKAILMAEHFNSNDVSEDIYSEAFRILDQVKVGIGLKALYYMIFKGIPLTLTFVQVLFDIKNMKIMYRTLHNKYKKTSLIHLDDFDFSAKSPVKILDFEKGNKDGIVSNDFKDYSREENDRIVKTSFASFVDEYPISEQDKLVDYPERLEEVE